MSKTLVIREIGRQSYEKILSQMKHFTNVRSESTADEIWILEHHPVFTQGQAGNSDYKNCNTDHLFLRLQTHKAYHKKK